MNLFLAVYSMENSEIENKTKFFILLLRFTLNACMNVSEIVRW